MWFFAANRSWTSEASWWCRNMWIWRCEGDVGNATSIRVGVGQSPTETQTATILESLRVVQPCSSSSSSLFLHCNSCLSPSNANTVQLSFNSVPSLWYLQPFVLRKRKETNSQCLQGTELFTKLVQRNVKSLAVHRFHFEQKKHTLFVSNNKIFGFVAKNCSSGILGWVQKVIWDHL